MTSLHTHYDNLKIARNAPPEVVRAAYRVLCQKYHPDKQPPASQADAERVMALVNEAYVILSDPLRRQQHDDWIAVQEGQSQQPPRTTVQDERPVRPSTAPADTTEDERPPAGKALVISIGTMVALYALGSYLFGSDRIATPRSMSDSKPVVVSPGVTEPSERQHGSSGIAYVPADSDNAPSTAATRDANGRRTTAPAGGFVPFTGRLDGEKGSPLNSNAAMWPTRSGYLPGQPVLAHRGLSRLTIDNSQNDVDVHVKVYSLSGNRAVRHIFIRASEKFTAAKLDKGNYEVRYKDLGSGDVAASKPFQLDQEASESGVRYSNVTMTLYKVVGGNMQMRRIPESEF